jgi:peroxiredoxin
MFENEADLRKLVGRLEIDARPNPTHCAALRRQMLAVFEEARRAQRPHILSADTWRTINNSKITKVAAAAVIVFAALIGVRLLTGPQEPTVTPLQEQLARIQAMYEVRDVNGLMAVIGQTQDRPRRYTQYRRRRQIEFDAQVLAAKYLGQIGDARALPELERLYLSAEENLPPGYDKNPFAEPIEKIKARIESDGQPIVPSPDVNEPSGAEVNDAAEPVANEAPAMGLPPQPEGVLELLAVNRDTNEPLADVKLSIEIQRQGPDDKRRQLTDANGQVTIQIGDLRTNHIRISVFKDHFVPLIAWFQKDEDQARLSIPATYSLALEPGTLIGGFVENEQGEPVEGVSVHLRAKGGEKDEIKVAWLDDHQVRTDANGFWLCDILPAELAYIRIWLTHPNYVDDQAYYTREPPPIEELRATRAVMVMEKGVDITGQVVDFTGQPIAGARVGQGSGSRRGIKYPRTETDAAGEFEFKSTRPGRVLLTVQAENYAPELREIDVRHGMMPVAFRLEPAGTIRGRVVDSDDNPIEDVEVSLDSWQGRDTIKWATKTGAKGYFEWNQAPKDRTLFTFAKEGYSAIQFLELWPDVDEHIIVLYRPLRVSGKVVDTDSNEPVGQFKLILGTRSTGQKAGGVDWDRRSTRTFTEGRYEVEPTWQSGYRGSYMVLVEADGYIPAVSGELTQDQEHIVLDFRLEKGQGPSGTVYLANGEPAASAKVALSTISESVFVTNGELQSVFVTNGELKDEKRWLSVTAGPDGRFSFPPQIERYLAVVVHDEGYAEVTQAQLAADANIVIQPWARLDGKLRVGGQALALETIHVDYYADYQQDAPRVNVSYSATSTDADGRFAWNRIVPGTLRIIHFAKVGGEMVSRTRQQVIEVLPGETVEVAIGGSGKTVVGRLVASPDHNEPVDWTSGQVALHLKLPEPPQPEDFNQMIYTEKRAWESKWERTEEGRLYKQMKWDRARSYPGVIDPNGTFRVEDVPAGTYMLRVSVGQKAGPASWSYGPRISRKRHGHTGTLEYELNVPEISEGNNVPLDVGTLELKITKRLKVGGVARPFEAETFDGKQIRIADYRGKVIVLVFWNSRPESMSWGIERVLGGIERVLEVLDSFAADDRIVVIGASLDRDIEAAKKFAKDNKLEWINCAPTASERVRMAEDYEVWRFPTTLVIGSDGRMLAVNPSTLLLQSTLEDALRPK